MVLVPAGAQRWHWEYLGTPYASQLQVQSAYHQHVEVHARVHGYPHVHAQDALD